MALDYRKCAEEIAANIGGGSNVISAAHCATRLRLVIADNSKVNKEVLENIDGVKGMFESNGQLQLIIGTGTVNKVYDEFLAVTGASAATKADVKAAAASKMPLWKKILKTPGDVFVPILPAIVASGLMMGLVEALAKAIPSFADSGWFGFLDMVANTAFALLPILVAISSARVFGGNIYLGAVIGMMMVHPGLMNAWTVSPTNQPAVWDLGIVKIAQVGYQGHVIPVILAVLLMSTLEKWLHKKVPEMIDLFVTPLVTVLVTAFATFVVIGPIFSVLENWVLKGAEWLVTSTGGVGALIMGALYPWTVVMGLHHMYNVIEAGMLSGALGLNIWMPIASAANFAQFGACAEVRGVPVRAVRVPGHHRARHLRRELPLHEALHRRRHRRRGGRAVRIADPPGRDHLRRHRHPRPAGHQQHSDLLRRAADLRGHRLCGDHRHLEGRRPQAGPRRGVRPGDA